MMDDIFPAETDGLESRARALCRPVLFEDLARGERELRLAFREAPTRIAPTKAVLISPEHPSNLHALRRGWACRIREWADGRSAITEIYVPGDVIGAEAALRDRPSDTVVIHQPAHIQTIEAAALPRLLGRSSTATYLAWLLAEGQQRAERRADWIARFEAHERLAAMLLDLYERLRRRELVTHYSYNLPLTQQQIGDHLGLTVVHVNRMVRLLREEKIVNLDRQVVMIRDLRRLRLLASGEGSSEPEAVASRLKPRSLGVVEPARTRFEKDEI
jgi:CRP/FNR family transcriptional regulator